MIEVTRLDGHAITINAELIEVIDANPDTFIRLLNGNSYVVQESRLEVMKRVIAYKQRCYRACSQRDSDKDDTDHPQPPEDWPA